MLHLTSQLEPLVSTFLNGEIHTVHLLIETLDYVQESLFFLKMICVIVLTRT